MTDCITQTLLFASLDRRQIVAEPLLQRAGRIDDNRGALQDLSPFRGRNLRQILDMPIGPWLCPFGRKG